VAMYVLRYADVYGELICVMQGEMLDTMFQHPMYDVQGEMLCEMLKHYIQHPTSVYFSDHLRRSSCFVVPLLHASLIILKDTPYSCLLFFHEGVVWKLY
jgi:hypothetical protein